MDVLKVTDIATRDKIELWTRNNSFPNVIKFIEDSKGLWIVGAEVLADPAYQNLAVKTDLLTKTTTVIYEPKAVVMTTATSK